MAFNGLSRTGILPFLSCSFCSRFCSPSKEKTCVCEGETNGDSPYVTMTNVLFVLVGWLNEPILALLNDHGIMMTGPIVCFG